MQHANISSNACLQTPCLISKIRDAKYMGKMLDRYGLAVGQGMSTFLSTGNVTSTSGLDLMQVNGRWRLFGAVSVVSYVLAVAFQARGSRVCFVSFQG